MFYYHHAYPLYPQPAAYPGYYFYPPLTRQYPPVDVKIFTKSIKSYRLLMSQGSILLNRLDDQDFDIKLMTAAQQGNKTEVDRLMKTIGLKVPVEVKYTPSGVTFELKTKPDPSSYMSCCTLTVNLKWGN